MRRTVVVDPAKYRQTLLDSVTDDGLEDLTLRLARDEYPQAHRSGKGKDGGIDVLSDFELPPARGWQSKNHRPIKWDECRKSLRPAMSDEYPPPRYTFVFPRPLTGPQRDFWRKKFLPEQRRRYPDLETLDFWDNLAERLEKHPELVDQLSEGASSAGYRAVTTTAAQTGVNPLASATDLIGDAPELARRAVEAGRTDPRYSYENRQREARTDDQEIPEGRVRFGFEALSGKPREFAVTLRIGRAVQEKAAGQRDEAGLEQVTVWFSDTEAGAEHRHRIRTALAGGRAVDLVCDPDVGLDARPLPDRFGDLADADGILRSGTTHLGLSEPLTLGVTIDTEAGPKLAEMLLYRIPSEPGYHVSYGGRFNGALVFLDANPDAPRPDGQPGRWSETTIAVGMDPTGVPATDFATGLGFILSFGRATQLHLECQGLLPDGGVTVHVRDQGVNDQAEEILQDTATLTAALIELTKLDGRQRYLPPSLTERDLWLAEIVSGLLHEGELRAPLERPYLYSIPGDAANKNPDEVMAGVRRPLGELGGQPTVVAEVRIDGPAKGRHVQINGGPGLSAAPGEGDAEVVMTLVGPVPEAPENGSS
jgi:hypothetical protein